MLLLTSNFDNFFSDFYIYYFFIKHNTNFILDVFFKVEYLFLLIDNSLLQKYEPFKWLRGGRNILYFSYFVLSTKYPRVICYRNLPSHLLFPVQIWIIKGDRLYGLGNWGTKPLYLLRVPLRSLVNKNVKARKLHLSRNSHL